MITSLRSLCACAIVLAIAGRAHADVALYVGTDPDVASISEMPNSVATAAEFDLAAPGLGAVDFENGVPDDFLLAGGTITNISGCGAHCGFNTTPGGKLFYSLSGSQMVFVSLEPMNAFGFYITGLQSSYVGQWTLTFFDGSTRVLGLPHDSFGYNGGAGAFFGFTDFGKTFTNVVIDTQNDVVAIDDIRYGFVDVPGGVPEPAAWTMMIAGFGLAGAAMRRRRRAARLAVGAARLTPGILGVRDA